LKSDSNSSFNALIKSLSKWIINNNLTNQWVFVSLF
jgi:hypothetical protein